MRWARKRRQTCDGQRLTGGNSAVRVGPVVHWSLCETSSLGREPSANRPACGGWGQQEKLLLCNGGEVQTRAVEWSNLETRFSRAWRPFAAFSDLICSIACSKSLQRPGRPPTHLPTQLWKHRRHVCSGRMWYVDSGTNWITCSCKCLVCCRARSHPLHKETEQNQPFISVGAASSPKELVVN